jgi:hypothetical protein
MSKGKAPRPVRVRATGSDAFDADSADWSCGFSVEVPSRDERSPEEWARAIWEDAPVAMRWLTVAGWRFVLGLRLGPRHSPDHVLGWRIIRRVRDETVVELESVFLTAHNVFRRDGTSLLWSTFVQYDRPIAALIWRPASLLHRSLARYALRRAGSRHSP